MTTEARIREIITEAVEGFDGSQLTGDGKFEESGLDSLDLASVLLEVQEEFDVTFPEGEEEQYDTLDKLVAYVNANKG